ncbi:hypothetical protein ZWY2020_028059 [Hordeum vulgare]|nr:hypothetical protein ZWY2020_028059 [Hordeum vulgare]
MPESSDDDQTGEEPPRDEEDNDGDEEEEWSNKEDDDEYVDEDIDNDAAATRHGSPFAGRSRRRGPGRGMHRTPSYTVIQVQNELKQNRASDGHVIAAPEKEALAAGCRKELAGLWAYFKEVSGHKMQIDGGGNLSSNAMIGCLLEESNLGLSKLVDETFQKLKGTEGVSVASVRSSVLLIGQRMMYGQSSPDADVLEDESDLSLWCSEVRDLKVLPMRTHGFLSVRRTARKKIHERITALHSTLSALETTGAEGQQYAYVDSLKLAGNGKEVWVYDIDETTLSNLPYYAKHGFGYIRSSSDLHSSDRLSGAKNLELIADYVMFLKNSPILERFTLELYKPFEHAYGIMSGTYPPKDQVLVSKHFKAFELNHRSTILNV